MNKKRLIIVVVALIIIVGFIWFFNRDEGTSGGQQQVSTLDSVDTVGNFYNQWLKAIKDPTTANPNQATLIKSPLLSKTLKDLLSKDGALGAIPDPVLCQTKTPENISIISIYKQENKAQVLVVSKDKKITEQAIITLNKIKNNWYIDEIECSAGEFAPEREFSFEEEGSLLKGSIPPPFNKKNWHLVFEEDGTLGNVVPLFFNSSSQCTSLNGEKAVCKPNEFKEATKVSVQAQMTELGATVKNLKFLK